MWSRISVLGPGEPGKADTNAKATITKVAATDAVLPARIAPTHCGMGVIEISRHRFHVTSLSARGIISHFRFPLSIHRLLRGAFQQAPKDFKPAYAASAR